MIMSVYTNSFCSNMDIAILIYIFVDTLFIMIVLNLQFDYWSGLNCSFDVSVKFYASNYMFDVLCGALATGVDEVNYEKDPNCEYFVLPHYDCHWNRCVTRHHTENGKDGVEALPIVYAWVIDIELHIIFENASFSFVLARHLDSCKTVKSVIYPGTHNRLTIGICKQTSTVLNVINKLTLEDNIILSCELTISMPNILNPITFVMRAISPFACANSKSVTILIPGTFICTIFKSWLRISCAHLKCYNILFTHLLLSICNWSTALVPSVVWTPGVIVWQSLSWRHHIRILRLLVLKIHLLHHLLLIWWWCKVELLRLDVQIVLRLISLECLNVWSCLLRSELPVWWWWFHWWILQLSFSCFASLLLLTRAKQCFTVIFGTSHI